MNFETLSHEYEQEFLEKVSAILEIPSIYEKSNHYPFGKPIDHVLKKILFIAEEDGFLTKNIDGYGGHVEYGEGEELIGILGHLDVVPPGEGWTTSPFEPVVKDGKLYARGAQDDKGPVMAAYIAMKLLKNQGFKPKKRIRLILGTDEESDWKGIDYYFKHEEMPSLGFTPDASFPVIHAEKGLLDSYMTYNVDANVKDRSIEVVQFKGGDRLNMVPDEATVIIRSQEGLRASFESYLSDHHLEGSIEEGPGESTLFVKGKAVHASKPEGGTNAITYLLGYLQTLPVHSSVARIFKELYEAFKRTDGRGMELDQSDDVSGSLTSNLGSLEFLDNTCKVGVNLRYPVTSEYKGILTKLKKFAAKGEANLEVFDHLPAQFLEKDHPFIQTLLTVYNKATGEEATVKTIGGATYARALDTGVAYGALFSDSPDTAHQKDEHVRLSDMVKAIEIYATSIYELTR